MKKPLLLLATATAVIAAPPEPKFTAQDIDKSVKIGYGTAIADVDGDKLPDILLADARQIRWYKNPGKRGAEWPRYVIAEELTKNDNVCIAAQDIDGDGKCEIAIGAEWNPGDTVNSGAVFYLIPPADRTQKWEPVKFPSVEPTTHRMKWFNAGAEWFDGGQNYWGLVVVPLHGRGNKNGEGAPVKVLFYRPPAQLNDSKGEWKSSVIVESQHATHNFHYQEPRALYFGGREGIIRSLPKGVGKWEQDTFEHTRESRGVGELRIGKVGRAFFCAVEPMHGNDLVVYPFGPGGGRQILTDKLNQGHALACADVLGTGGDQIIVGWRGGKPGDSVGLAVWTALDDKGEQWRETVIDTSTACEDLAVADLDGDGKPDIIAAGRASHNLRILWNDR